MVSMYKSAFIEQFFSKDTVSSTSAWMVGSDSSRNQLDPPLQNNLFSDIFKPRLRLLSSFFY